MAMIVDDLITFADKGITNKNVQVIKSMLLALVRYVEKEPQSCILGELGKLQNRAFLPIREPGGSRATLMYSDSRFFIPDRQALCDRFKDSLPLMDFTIDQIHHIRPLIDNLGISQKSLLSAVTETWTPIGSRLEDLESTEKLRSKSQALFR